MFQSWPFRASVHLKLVAADEPHINSLWATERLSCPAWCVVSVPRWSSPTHHVRDHGPGCRHGGGGGRGRGRVEPERRSPPAHHVGDVRSSDQHWRWGQTPPEENRSRLTVALTRLSVPLTHRERVPLRSLEESRAESHELGDHGHHGALLQLQRYTSLIFNPWQKGWNHRSWRMFIKLFYFGEKKNSWLFSIWTLWVYEIYLKKQPPSIWLL